MVSLCTGVAASIAVIDSDEAICDAIRLILLGEEWCVHTYYTGEDFLAQVDRHSLDCIILDPHLTGLTGSEVARSLCINNSDITIIGLTARPDSFLAIDLANAGARVVLTKPVTAEHLIDEIKAAIGNEQKGR